MPCASESQNPLSCLPVPVPTAQQGLEDVALCADDQHAKAYLELVVTQNLLLVGWILHISAKGWAGIEEAAVSAKCSAKLNVPHL